MIESRVQLTPRVVYVAWRVGPAARLVNRPVRMPPNHWSCDLDV
jgi:hypothetical protein